MTPLPVAESFDAFNARLVDACTKRRQAILRGHRTTIAERMQADLAAFMKLPPAPYEREAQGPCRHPRRSWRRSGGPVGLRPNVIATLRSSGCCGA